MADCNGGRKTGGKSAAHRNKNLIEAIAGRTAVTKRDDRAEDGSDVEFIIGTARISAEVSLGRAVISHY